MTTKKVVQPYIADDLYVIRPLCPTWITERTAELGEETADKAIGEAVEMLLEHLGDQVMQDGNISVHFPDTEGAPYIVTMMKDSRNGYQRRRDDAIDNPVEVTRIAAKNNLRDEFEDLIYTLPEGVRPDDLKTNDKGQYVNPRTIGLWRGFQLYHYKLTIAVKQDMPTKFNRCLGRYVLATLSRNGSPTFVRSPIGHNTQAGALQEANRLSIELERGVGVFRCLDVVEAYAIPETTKLQETAEQE